MSSAGKTEQDILNQVTGSNSYLAGALAGTGLSNSVETNGITGVTPQYQSLDSGAISLDIPGGILGDSSTSIALPGFPGSTGTPTVLPQTSDSTILNDPIGSILKGIDSLDPTTPNASGQTALGKALGIPSFFTSPGRIGTSIVGIVFIGAGLFLLGKGPAVQIVKGAAEDLALGR